MATLPGYLLCVCDVATLSGYLPCVCDVTTLSGYLPCVCDVTTLSGYLPCVCALTLSMVLRSLNERSIHASLVVGSTNSLHTVGRKFSQSPSMLLFTRRAMDLDCSTTIDSVEPSAESSSSRTNCKRMAGSTVKPVYKVFANTAAALVPWRLSPYCTAS